MHRRDGVGQARGRSSCSTLIRVEPYASLCRMRLVRWVLHLAVPSFGSNPMHHNLQKLVLCATLTCSTLIRVEPYASRSMPSSPLSTSSLQYPHSGRTLCILVNCSRPL